MHLLVDARHAREDRRPHGRKRRGRLERVGQERERVADVGPGQVHEPAEVVRERQVEQHDVADRREALEMVDDGHHGVVVAVRDHAALRRPRRPRRVDVREEVVLRDGRGCLAQRVRMLLRVRAAACGEVVEVGVGEDMAQLRQLAAAPPSPSRAGPRPRRGRRQIRVAEDVAGVRGRAVRVDRRADGADRAESKVEERPLDARRAEQSEGVALADAEGKKPVRVCLDPFRRLGPRDGLPVAVPLVEVGGRVALGRDGVAPEPCDRPLPGRLLLSHETDSTPAAAEEESLHAEGKEAVPLD